MAYNKITHGGLEGISNASEVPSRKQAYYQASKTVNKSNRDPLSTLITKHQNDGKSGVIRKMQINEHSFNIVLMVLH